ncbi:hypothetical protein [Actinomadura madurae]|uniref:hypothetical protein n=1 Tax=Actinomadura madurae TaxID=1993 RepID=UPI00202721C1|nr:hypothetical protein [Actinomadura madurae]MCP9950992.1 hypothetical protein [Actinomadura madurae]MCP9967777.1 hypothetical protein [Actinomadura madurae]MCP9980229.1 hypothetical protein [Actinomadura madurae]MCQ0008249.1 hypothetical protein [Actinomadura madurae]MCQ0016437.1 hypothetical protein [Actinomadura madurae]
MGVVSIMLRAEDFMASADVDTDVAANVLAYVAELERRGVVVSDVEHEPDADGTEEWSFRLKIANRWLVRVMMPVWPLEWVQRPEEFEEQRANIEWQGDIYVDGSLDGPDDFDGEYPTWEEAVEAGVRIAQSAEQEV